MLSRLLHYIPAIRPPIPCLPSSLGLSRMYSWSSQSQPANWSHLNDIYGKAVDVNPKGTSMSPEERWDMLSRSRTTISTLPRGPYAGKLVRYIEATNFSYVSRKEFRGETWQRCRCTEQATVHPAEEQGCSRT